MFADWPTFLSSSTIHGLSHLPASRGLARLFWLSVVITGFGGASFLIVKSFRGWEESPISTSVSVLPITQITFPNLTVCPPRGTFTSLNYDLVRSADLSEEDREELVDFVVEFYHRQMMDFVESFEVRDRWRDWYRGWSEIKLPAWSNITQQLHWDWMTVAQSGQLVTPHYGESWQDEKFLNNLMLRLTVSRPWTEPGGNISFQIEQDLSPQDGGGVAGPLLPGRRNLTLEKELEEEEEEEEEEIWITLERALTEEEVAGLRGRGRVPGMRVSWVWQGPGDVTAERTRLADNLQFRRLANLVQQAASRDQVWLLVRRARRQLDLELGPEEERSVICEDNIVTSAAMLEQKVDQIEAGLGVTGGQAEDPSISDSDLRAAGEMYLYLLHCPTDQTRMADWFFLYTDLFRNYSRDTIALTMARIVTTVEDGEEFDLALAVFDKVWRVLKLRSRDISLLSRSHSDNREDLITAQLYNHSPAPEKDLKLPGIKFL